MVCGFHPFASDNIATTMDLIAEATISFPSPYWDEVSEAVKDLIVQRPNGTVIVPARSATPDAVYIATV